MWVGVFLLIGIVVRIILFYKSIKAMRRATQIQNPHNRLGKYEL